MLLQYPRVQLPDIIIVYTKGFRTCPPLGGHVLPQVEIKKRSTGKAISEPYGPVLPRVEMKKRSKGKLISESYQEVMLGRNEIPIILMVSITRGQRSVIHTYVPA